MRSDAGQAATLARIEELVAAAPSAPLPNVPERCTYHSGDEDRRPLEAVPLTGPGDPGDLPQGSYRYRLTRDQLLAAGLPPGDARLNAGVLTWTLRDGGWRSEQEPDFPEATQITGTTCAGWYDVRG